MNKTITVSLLVSFTTIPVILKYLLERTYQRLALKLKEKNNNYYYQCIFFDYKNFNCKPHLINKQDCGDFCSYTNLERLLKFVSTAKKSISLCMYMITLKQVTDELIYASRRGVKVRVITDFAMSKTTPSKSNLSQLTKAGISYKSSRSNEQMMHNKFCLIDEHDRSGAKMFYGSVNLTAQAFCKNFESLVLTNNWEIIQRLSEEFEELWELF